MQSPRDPSGTSAPQAGASQKGILSTFRAARGQALGELLALLQSHHAGRLAHAQRPRERAVRPGAFGAVSRSSGIGVDASRLPDDLRVEPTPPPTPPSSQAISGYAEPAADPRLLDAPSLKDTQVFHTHPTPVASAAEQGGAAVPQEDRPVVMPGTGSFLRPPPRAAPSHPPRIRSTAAPVRPHEPLAPRTPPLAPKLDLNALDQYQVLNEIGTDGAESCYRALHRESGRVVVLVTRRMTTEMAKKATVRLSAWALETSGITHHAIPRVTGWGSVEGTVYFTVSTNSSATLEHVLQRGESPGYVQVLRILQSVADALDHIHARGASHGDLRPNCILVRDDALGADLLGSGLDAALRAEIPDAPWDSSAAYLAPECWARRKPADARADQFALAVIAFELITGRRRGSHTESTGMIAVDPIVVPPLAPLRPEAPVNVNAALIRALSARPTVRYASCGEFITALIGDSLAERKEERRFRLWR